MSITIPMSNKEIVTAIESLPADQQKILVEKLAASVEKIDAMKAGAAKRKARIEAAAGDPDMRVAFAHVTRGLRQLGLELDQVAAAGDTKLLDAAMTAAGWDSTRRMQLKSIMANVGILN